MYTVNVSFRRWFLKDSTFWCFVVGCAIGLPFALIVYGSWTGIFIASLSFAMIFFGLYYLFFIRLCRFDNEVKESMIYKGIMRAGELAYKDRAPHDKPKLISLAYPMGLPVESHIAVIREYLSEHESFRPYIHPIEDGGGVVVGHFFDPGWVRLVIGLGVKDIVICLIERE